MFTKRAEDCAQPQSPGSFASGSMERFGRINVERTVPAQARDRRRVVHGPGTIYTATSGTLTFLAGESTERIEVSVLDDAHDKGEETLMLSSAS